MKKFLYCLLMCFVTATMVQGQNNCPAIAGTSYSNAPVVRCNLDGFTGRLFPPGFGGLETPFDFAATCGVIDNSHWIAFSPLFSSATFHIQVNNCTTGEGMQGAIYGIDPSSCELAALYPVTPCLGGGTGVTDMFFFPNNFEQGEMYYLMLDGYNGDVCDYTINLYDVVPFPIPQATLSGPTAVASGSTHSYSINLPTLPNVNNPCGNFVQDDCVCPPCYTGYFVPTVVEWTGPPGSTVTVTSFYTVDITFGDESGEVCVHLEGDCGEVDYCVSVQVGPLCNSPAPPGDSCATAPLFCADYLDGYCSSTAGLSPNIPGNINNLLSCNIDNNAWIRIAPCEDSIGLILDVGDCLANQGLEFALLETDDCDTFNLVQDCITIDNNSIDTLNIYGLTAGAVYYLMIDGINGDECDFSINILGGVPPPDTSSVPDTIEYVLNEIVPAMIIGPDIVCYGEAATYTYVPPVCVLEEGDCNGNIKGDGSSSLNSNSACPLPDEACQTPWLVRVDTFLVWHLPDGGTFIGDSSGYTVDVLFEPFSNCIDTTYSDSLFNVEADSCMAANFPMIPTDSSGVIRDTVIQEVWVEIGFTFLLPDSSLVDWIPSDFNNTIPDSFYWFNPEYLNIYCDCPAGRAFCGSCNYGASTESGVIIEYHYNNITICEPECMDFCGASLCGAGQYWCRRDCGYDIVNLNIDQPQTFNLGFFEVCPWDCVFISELGQYFCGEGIYDEILLDPISGCEDHYLFEILEYYVAPINIYDVVEECSPDGSTYTVSFSISGEPPFDVNGTIVNDSYTSFPIPSGDPYYFEAMSISLNNLCLEYAAISGQVDCPCSPGLDDLGTVDVCPGDCYIFPQNGELYCALGPHLVEIPDPANGCIDSFLFEIVEIPIVPVNITIVSEDCLPDNSGYTVTINISGNPPFDVNGYLATSNTFTSLFPIASGSPYSFFVTSLATCPDRDTIYGLVDCMPCNPQTTDLGTIDLCPGECYTLADNGETYCTPGNYVIPIIIDTANNCVDTILFELNELPLETVSIISVQEDCSVDNTTYTITLEIDGNPPFLVNGVLHNSNTYVSAAIPSGDAYTFSVGSTATCVNGDVISGNFTCICVPQTTDLGTIDLCPGECFTLPDNGVDYCVIDSYAIPILNTTTNCTDTVFFVLNELPQEVVVITNPSEFCIPDNSAYVVAFEISGNPPFLVNGTMVNANAYISTPIPSGDTYSFVVESTATCFIGDQVDGDFTCPPCVPQLIELDTIRLCPGECFDYYGDSYCTEGDYNLDITNSDGCVDTHHFYLDIGETTMPSISGLIELCDVTFTSYTVSFTILGQGPFFVNGNPLPFNDNLYISNTIPSGSSYVFEVTHSGPCAIPIIIAGNFSCQSACSIAAGTLSESLTYLCDAQSIQVNHNSDETLGSDDILEFILYQGIDPVAGQIYDRNVNGLFPFNPGTMTFGTPYQVVAVVGNQVSGQVDLNDNCLNISNDISLVYYELPEIENGQIQDSLILTCLEPEVILVNDFKGGSGQFSVDWSGQGLTSDSNSLATQVPGLFYFTVTDLLTGCTAKDSSMVLENKIFPVIQVAPLQALDCANDQVIIDASNSEQGPPFEFSWRTLDGHFTGVPGSLSPEVDSAGTYILQIINTESGCVSEDSIEIEDLGDELQFVELYIEDAICHGSQDASISIEHIEGGTPGYEISFNDFEFNDQVLFENLGAGEYTLHIEDSKGCTLDTSVTVRHPVVMDVGLQENYLVYLGDPIDITASPNFEPGAITWIDQHGEILSDSSRLVSVLNRSGVINMEVVDINGCVFRQEIFVRVGAPEALTFVPSAFSPNSDGTNDLLRIFPHASVKTIKSFNIFSRWGDLVFSCSNTSPDPSGNSICSWDGTLKGQAMDPAVFVYILELELIDGDRRILTGDIMLIR